MISIIIPVYNVAVYLNECIQSIVNQVYDDWECILVNDGSTDMSGEICDEWAEKDLRIHVIHQNNCGASIARNIGIAKASGDYITFVDSDDFISPSYLSDMMDYTNENAELYISGLVLYPFKPEYQPSVPLELCTFSLNEHHVQQFVQLDKQWLLNSPCAKLYKASIVKEYGIKFNPKLSLGEDLRFNYAYLEKVTHITTIPKVNYFYRIVGDTSLSNKYRENLFDLSYEQWHIVKHFYVSRGMWNALSERHMSHILWAYIYDGIFEYPKREEKTQHYIERILSIEEIVYLKKYVNDYNCARWIKIAIIHRCAWLFYLYFWLER